MSCSKILIIGSGITGLSCAGMLADAGLNVMVLDKGRGVGGRLATKRTRCGRQFDHGAQYVTARAPDFHAVLRSMRAAATVDVWEAGAPEPHFVGVPGMSGLPKHLVTGLDVSQNTTVETVAARDGGWTVTTQTDSLAASHVVVTTPAPQITPLIGVDHPLTRRLLSVEMAPCLTLMAAFKDGQPIPFTSKRMPQQPLSWIAYNSSKPSRLSQGCWVAQASVDWSVENLERDNAELAELMLPMLCAQIGADPSAAQYVAAHRWRYARSTSPLGEPFLRDNSRTLYLGGDWCIGPRVEAGWISGRAIADDILKRI